MKINITAVLAVCFLLLTGCESIFPPDPPFKQYETKGRAYLITIPQEYRRIEDISGSIMHLYSLDTQTEIIVIEARPGEDGPVNAQTFFNNSLHSLMEDTARKAEIIKTDQYFKDDKLIRTVISSENIYEKNTNGILSTVEFDEKPGIYLIILQQVPAEFFEQEKEKLIGITESVKLRKK